jgi:hypothetical protein
MLPDIAEIEAEEIKYSKKKERSRLLKGGLKFEVMGKEGKGKGWSSSSECRCKGYGRVNGQRDGRSKGGGEGWRKVHERANQKDGRGSEIFFDG